MTQDQAIRRADHLAKLRDVEYFVVWVGDYDQGHDYHVCDLETLETFYSGIEPVYSTAMGVSD